MNMADVLKVSIAGGKTRPRPGVGKKGAGFPASKCVVI